MADKDKIPANGAETTVVLPDPETMARNFALMYEEYGKAMSAFLAPREEGKAPLSMPDESAEIVKTLGKVAESWLSDPQRAVQAQSELWQGVIALWAASTNRMIGQPAEVVAQPSPDDKRFKDPDWTNNVYFDFTKQLYLLTTRWAEHLVKDADGLDAHTRHKAEFYIRQIGAAMSPSNYLMTNPEVMKETLASNGEGGYPHLAFELLASMAGFKFLHVPYKGATQIATDVISGQVLTGIGSFTGMSTQINAGRMRLIGVTNHVRVPNNRELPIFSELVPGYDMRGWFGYVAPAGTPRDIVQKLNAEINRAMQLPEVNAKLTGSGLIVVNESADYYTEFIKTEYAKYGKIVRDIGLKPQ